MMVFMVNKHGTDKPTNFLTIVIHDNKQNIPVNNYSDVPRGKNHWANFFLIETHLLKVYHLLHRTDKVEVC